jgi:murein DD-endopeptidase MepM/ murein hydrolase activator NlpD
VVLDQARPRGASRRLEAERIDLGNEPPLAVDGGSGGLVDRRRLSVQWFSGTILTGLCGAALMGGAVFASLDGQTTFAAAPERVETALRGALNSLGDRLSGVHRSDRLPAPNEPSVVHEVLRVSSITRSGNRELVRVHPYMRVTGNLALTVSDLSANIPPFNPQKLLTSAVAGNDQTPAEPDAEVSFVTCDLAPPLTRSKVMPAICDINSLLPRVKPATLLPLDEVMTRVRDVAKTFATSAPVVADADTTSALGYAAEAEPDAYFGFAARVVPENVTLLPKTTPPPNAGSDGSERVIVAKKGDTVGSILRDLGAAPEEIKEIVAVLGPQASSGELKEGEKVRVLLAPMLFGQARPERVIIAGDKGIHAAAALSDMGTYVPVDIGNIDTEAAEPATAEEDDSDDNSSVRLYRSLYETALRNKIPKSVIEEMVRVFAFDVDFHRRVKPGDSFDVLYADDGTDDGWNEVRYVSLTLGGETKRYYHFQTTDDGIYDYYDDSGRSANKFLVRKPVAVGIESSPFGWRTNPLLHIRELHTGVDWAAPMGTPIFAAGDGTIEEIGPHGGYGNYVRIRHADGYETDYAHMTAFARGLHVGSRVRQGQIIGFVGSTGLSTGAHVHFEIRVNGRFVDPMRVKLPRGRVLEGPTLAQFEKARDQLDALLASQPARVAQAR